eukprot:PhM_4_TR4014/c0_g1_i1/m.1176
MDEFWRKAGVAKAHTISAVTNLEVVQKAQASLEAAREDITARVVATKSATYETASQYIDVDRVAAVASAGKQRVQDFFDVEKAIEPIRREQEALRKRIAQDKEAASSTLAELAVTAAQTHAKMEDVYTFYRKASLTILNQIDDESLQKLVCEEAKNTVGQQSDSVEQILTNELSTYGYRSRFLHTLGISFAALQDKVRRGEPFLSELRAVQTSMAELGPSMHYLYTPFEKVATTGVMCRDELIARLPTAMPISLPTPTHVLDSVQNTAGGEGTWGEHVARTVCDAIVLDSVPLVAGGRRAPTTAVGHVQELLEAGRVAEAVDLVRTSARSQGGVALETWCRQASEHGAAQQMLSASRSILDAHRHAMVGFLVSQLVKEHEMEMGKEGES